MRLHLDDGRGSKGPETKPSVFTANNDGTISHALDLTGNGIDRHTPDLAFGPGHFESFTVTLKPGTYQFSCPIDGHRGLGMQGTLVVH